MTSLLDEIRSLEWERKAKCRRVHDEQIFQDYCSTMPTVCRRCPVRQNCLDVSLLNAERFLVWGGIDSFKRSKLRRQLVKIKEEFRSDIDPAVRRVAKELEQSKMCGVPRVSGEGTSNIFRYSELLHD